MTKDEAKEKLRRAESDLRQANVVLEMHEQGIKEIEDKIAELQEIINKPDRWQDGLVQPEKEKYFYLMNNAYKGIDIGLGSETDRKPEHAFRTKEQAELIKEKTLLMWEMYNFAHVRNDGWVPDWGGLGEKFGILYSVHKGLEVEDSVGWNRFVFGVSVKSQEIAEEMLEEFGERIEKFYNKMY